MVDPRRVEAGYDYCTRVECQERFVERVELASVSVNKAADQYVRAEDVVPREPRPRWGIDEEDDEGASRPARPVRKPPPKPSTEARLRRASDELDAALLRVYESFCRSEITHSEMRSEQNALIRAFNDGVRSENIRYRSLLRKSL